MSTEGHRGVVGMATDDTKKSGFRGKRKKRAAGGGGPRDRMASLFWDTEKN